MDQALTPHAWLLLLLKNQSAQEGARMQRCTACVELAGRPASVKPHAALRTESTAIRSEGQFQEYKCRSCGTRWHRILAKTDSGLEPQLWRVVARTDSHV
jgi:cytochrome c2